MSQETINLLIGALIGIVSALLSQIAGNYFQRKNDERKRKWELEDREFDRRIIYRDSRIPQARKYLNAYRRANEVVFQFQSRILHARDMEEIKTIQTETGFDKLDELLDFTLDEERSINYLGDLDLIELNRELRSLCNQERLNAINLVFRHGLKEKEPLDTSALYNGANENRLKILALIVKMQKRIENLAEQVS